MPDDGGDHPGNYVVEPVLADASAGGRPGPDAAINAVYYNQLQAIEDDAARDARRAELRAEYAEDIDILHLASELIIDAVIQPEELRGELIKRFTLAAGKHREWPDKNNPVTPA